MTWIGGFCKNKSIETIIFKINNVDLCFGITDKNVGIEKIGVLICDIFLICDTIFYSLVSKSPALTATPDINSTSIISSNVIKAIGNNNIANDVLIKMELISANSKKINDYTLTYPNQRLGYQSKVGRNGWHFQNAFHLYT